MRINLLQKSITFLLILFVLASCSSKRNLVYFSDLQDSVAYQAAIQNRESPRIQTDDVLSITVSTLNAESNVLFNSGTLVPMTSNTPAGISKTEVQEGYLVDANGEINFPVAGKVKLTGLTKEEARAKMEATVGKYVKDPIINIRFLNFKVTVIGEVMHPSSFTIPNEKINVLEALGMAGDMTPFGKRENVLVIREKDGQRNIERLNLNSKEVFASPYFYLQQNDVVYVEPDNKEKSAQTTTNYRLLPILTATISALAVVLTTILR